jgi:hypothetical protein
MGEDGVKKVEVVNDVSPGCLTYIFAALFLGSLWRIIDLLEILVEQGM